MGLTVGTGPFGQRSAGAWSAGAGEQDRVLYLEPTPKRIRVVIGGETVADSRNATILHETGELPVYYLPRADVREDLFEPTDTSDRCPIRGEATYFDLTVDGRTVDQAAWAYRDPLPQAPDGIADLVAFEWEAVDVWLEEDEVIDVHPRDPYHRIDVRQSSRHVVVRIDGETVAESHRPRVLFETSLPPRYYLPPEDIDASRFTPSDTVTRCPYKGTATHRSYGGGEDVAEDVAWSYGDPLAEALPVAGWWSFYPQRVEVLVDGEPLRA